MSFRLPPPPAVHARRRRSRSAPPAVLGHQPRGRIACLRQRRHRPPGSAAVCGGALHWGESVQLLGGAAVSYTHLRAHETPEHLVCRLLLERKKKNTTVQ